MIGFRKNQLQNVFFFGVAALKIIFIPESHQWCLAAVC
jgi:hypothetical protein